ncbi:heptosyltransferase III [Planctomycetaceae bacterium]|nr:heptosyltransferase III [Planctomycetaceae bacterium]
MSEPRRILVVRTDRLGDVILTLPMLAVLRARYPDAWLGMLLSRYTGEIVRNHPHVNAFIWHDDAGEPRASSTLIAEVRAQRFDTVFLVHPTPRLAWIMARAGIPQRIGTGYRYYSVLMTHRVFEHRTDAKYHELEYNLRLLGALDAAIQTAGVKPDFGLRLQPDAVARIASVLRENTIGEREPFVVIHPGSGGSARDWPLPRFGALGARLARDPGIRIVVTGGQRESDAVHAVVKDTGPRAIPLAGVLSLPELAALYARATVVVANSTGPLHLAAALGTPVVGIYPQLTPMSPARWGPYTERKRVLVPDAPVDCRMCRKGERCVCIESITVDQVHDATRSFISHTSQDGTREGMHAQQG